MILFHNVSKSYKSNNYNSVALENISFRIHPKEFVSIVGKSGAGKSTIIKLLVGEEMPTDGRIIFNSWDVTKLSSRDLYKMRRRIGTVFQDFKLLPDKTAYENIAFALEVSGRSQKEINKIVPRSLEIVGIPDKANDFPREMSGGEKQRVAIARAMVNNPDLIIADEPTGNLDPITEAEIIELLLEINKIGTTVLLATHNKQVVDSIQRRVISIKDGKIIKDEEKGVYTLF